MKVKILLYLLCAVLFTACSSGSESGDYANTNPNQPENSGGNGGNGNDNGGNNGDNGGEQENPPVIYDFSNIDKVSFAWNDNAVVGIYTVSNTRIRTTIQQIDADKHNATLTCNGWGMTPNTQYYAYFPYSSYYFEHSSPMTALPISFVGQKQSANRSAAHLAAYDFMTAQAKTGADNVSFALNHLCSIVRLACLMPESETFTDLTLTTDGTVEFTADATMDVTNNSITKANGSNTFSLALNNITVAAKDSLIAYLMLPPTDFSNKTLTLKLTTKGGRTATTTIAGCSTQAGYTYPVTIRNITFGNSSAKGSNATLFAKNASKEAEETAPVTRADTPITLPKATAKDMPVDKTNMFKEN